MGRVDRGQSMPLQFVRNRKLLANAPSLLVRLRHVESLSAWKGGRRKILSRRCRSVIRIGFFRASANLARL